MQTTKIAIAGLGTVGQAVIEILNHRRSLIERRIGGKIEIVGISARDKGRSRMVDITPYAWFDSPLDMLSEARPDIAIELIGGADGIAYEFAKASIANGVHLVTANKAMLAERGNELAQLSEKAGVTIAYEAAIGGGIPIVKSLREAAGASDVSKISGILNGTCNFILTSMVQKGSDFQDALLEAQELGYAEQDPSFDIGGMDAGHKIVLLSALAFGGRVNLAALRVEGIEKIDIKDIHYAKELGCCIKLLANAERTGAEGTKTGVRQSVAMRMLSLSHPLAHVEDSFNAVDYRDDYNERITLEGRGAGGGATASAVMADILDLVRGVRYPLFGVPYDSLVEFSGDDGEAGEGGEGLAYYVRFDVRDVAGVLSRISRSFYEHGISVESLIQHGKEADMPVSVVFITHVCGRRDLLESLAEIRGFDFMLDEPCVIEFVS